MRVTVIEKTWPSIQRCESLGFTSFSLHKFTRLDSAMELFFNPLPWRGLSPLNRLVAFSVGIYFNGLKMAHVHTRIRVTVWQQADTGYHHQAELIQPHKETV